MGSFTLPCWFSDGLVDSCKSHKRWPALWAFKGGHSWIRQGFVVRRSAAIQCDAFADEVAKFVTWKVGSKKPRVTYLPPPNWQVRAWKLMVGRRFLSFSGANCQFQGGTYHLDGFYSGEGQPHPNWWSMEEKMEESWPWNGVRAITITQTGAGLSGRFRDCQINFFGGTPSAGAQAPQQKQWKVCKKNFWASKEPWRNANPFSVFGLSCGCFGGSGFFLRIGILVYDDDIWVVTQNPG